MLDFEWGEIFSVGCSLRFGRISVRFCAVRNNFCKVLVLFYTVRSNFCVVGVRVCTVRMEVLYGEKVVTYGAI